MRSGTAEHFSKWGGGGGGLTSDLKSGGGGWGAEETLLLVSLYFFGKKIWVAKAPHNPPAPQSLSVLILNKTLYHKRNGTPSYISHLFATKCKFVLRAVFWAVTQRSPCCVTAQKTAAKETRYAADSSVLQTEHSSKSYKNKIYHGKNMI